MKGKIFKLVLLAALLTLICAALTGCVPGDGANNYVHPAGFFTGIWHGWIAPVSLIISVFDRTRSIYEVHNTGLLYNLGYYMGIVGGFGCLSFTRKRYKHGD